LAFSFARAGELDRALQVAATVKGDNDKSEVLRNIVSGLAKAGQYDRAKEVASTIKDGNNKARALVYIATRLAEAGQVADALQVVSTIEDRTSRPDRRLLDTVMGLIEAKQYNPALQMANAIGDENTKAWTLAWLAKESVEAGQTELAAQAIKPALEIVGFEQLVRP
jgi:thioredoxin-like negative regulator of GroEL